MSINVTITAASPEELAQLLQGLASVVPGVATVAEPKEPKHQNRKTTETKTVEPTKEASPVPETQVTTSAGAPEEPAVTLEAVRARLAALVRAGKQADVKALFPKFNASKLSEVPEERLGELMAAAKEIA